MSDTITLEDLTDALIWEAGIDGKTGPNARHLLPRLYELINRQYKQLRSIVTQNGEEFFRTRTTAATIPARAAGEDYIAVTWPTAASEIISVDVFVMGCWRELTQSSRRQWRVWPGTNRPDSPGEWSTVSMPQPVNSDTPAPPTDGIIALWPYTLSGSYAIDYVPHWVPATNTAHVFVLFPHWEEWLLASCTMVISQRDNNKRNMFVDARDRKAEAQAQIIAHCRRSKRGSVVARRRDGLEL
jgi:hypothetical protein